MHFLGFSRESGNQVCSQHNIRHLFPHIINHIFKVFNRISTVHAAEHFIIPMLYRQMHMTGHLGRRGHHIHHFPCHISRMRGHIPHAFYTVHFIQSPDKIGKIGTVLKIKAIGIDVLPQKGNFLISFRCQSFHFCTDILYGAAGFSAADIRNYTVRAELVAPLHNRHPGKDIALAGSLQSRIVSYSGRLHLRKDDMGLMLQFFCDNILQIMNIVRSDNEVNNRHALNQLAAVFLRHASGNPYKKIGVLILQRFNFPYFPVYLFFRILPYTACVQNDNVRLIHLPPGKIAQFFQLSVNLFRIRFIHLAAIRNGPISFISLFIHYRILIY